MGEVGEIQGEERKEFLVKNAKIFGQIKFVRKFVRNLKKISMVNIKFYLDSNKDKNLNYPLYLQIRQKGVNIKVFIGEKIKRKDWDEKTQHVKESYYNHKFLNKYVHFLRTETEKFIEKTPVSKLTDKKIKEKITSLVSSHKNANSLSIVCENEEYLTKQKLTFIDLFAGAGGFSEGFLQAESNNKIFDFLLASDINDNCELTHRMRYNYQLGLDAEFITQDITEPTFLDNLLKKIVNKTIK